MRYRLQPLKNRWNKGLRPILRLTFHNYQTPWTPLTVAISTRKFLWSWQCPKGDNGATNLRAMRRHTGVATTLVIIALLILPSLAFTVIAAEEADATLDLLLEHGINHIGSARHLRIFLR